MRTAAFVLFAVVTAAAAALSTLVATRHLTVEKELAEARFQLEEISRERKRQEEEKIVLRLERERLQADLEARFAEQRSQLEECANQRQRDYQDILTHVLTVQKILTDVVVRSAPSAVKEAAGTGQEGAASPEAPPRVTDVPKGAIPTPEQEARKLEKAQ
jgi:regulator of replication initiation timing